MIGQDLSPHKALNENVSPIYYYIQENNEFQDERNIYFEVSEDFLFECPPDIRDPDHCQPRKLLKKASGENWYHPSKKAYCYYEIIDAEKAKIIDYYKSIYDKSKSLNEAEFQVQKEIHILSTLAKKLQEYTIEQVGLENNFEERNSNHYVICLLRETIIDLLLTIYQLFEGLINIKVKSSDTLRAEYFGQRPFVLKHLISDENTVYLSHRRILKKIFKEFNEEIFHCNNENDFCEIFAINDTQHYPFEIKQKGRFYYLLDKLWEEKDDFDSKISKIYSTKGSYIKPFLERYKGNFNVFGNRTILRSERTEDKRFISKVDNIFK